MEHALYACVGATLASAAICVLLDRAAPASWKREVSCSPLWSWYVGGFNQAILFPVCTAYGLLPVFRGQMGFIEWLRCSFSAARNRQQWLRSFSAAPLLSCHGPPCAQQRDPLAA